MQPVRTGIVQPYHRPSARRYPDLVQRAFFQMLLAVRQIQAVQNDLPLRRVIQLRKIRVSSILIRQRRKIAAAHLIDDHMARRRLFSIYSSRKPEGSCQPDKRRARCRRPYLPDGYIHRPLHPGQATCPVRLMLTLNYILYICTFQCVFSDFFIIIF